MRMYSIANLGNFPIEISIKIKMIHQYVKDMSKRKNDKKCSEIGGKMEITWQHAQYKI